MKQLPDYLKLQVNAAPFAHNVILMGDLRVTVITPRLLRMEQRAFTDDATLAVICRDLGECTFTYAEKEGVHALTTSDLLVVYDPAKGVEEGLSIRGLKSPGFLWHYGEKPLQNLGGTTSTLDGVNGECPIEDGVCALDGFTVFDDSASPLMTQDGWFAPREDCLDLYFFGYGRDYTACVKDYYRLTGIPEMLPAFALGNWWSRYHAYTAEEYLDLMDQFDEHDVPLSVGIVDMDWHITRGENIDYWKDGWTGYTWNEELFPDYRDVLNKLHQRGLRTALNLHPALGVRPWDKQYADMARAMGIDPETSETVPFNCLDPQFLQAYFEILHFPYEKDGVDFWWMDWQQGADYRKVIGKRYEKSPIECIHPLWMLNHMHYMASKREGKRGLIFSRYSGFGSQRYPIGFSGDTFITWDSLRFQPRFTATASNIGYGWWSHDIGGHMGGYRDDELTVRWIQLGVFSPIFRLHSTDSIFLGREPWNYNPRAQHIIEDLMRLRHRLFPYLYTMNHRNHAELLPLVRPMYHTHPDCPQAYQVPNEYWFGSELLCAPITDKADSTDLACVSAWLPDGLWTDMNTGYIYRGGQTLRLYRPMEEMPVFMKAGAILPLQEHTPHSRILGAAQHMEVLVAPGASGAFTLYEDDGETMAYRQGACCTTAMTLDWADRQAVFTIAPAAGDLTLIPEKRQWTIRFRGFRQGCTAQVNGQAVPMAYDRRTNTFTLVAQDVDASHGVQVVITHEDALLHDNRDGRDRVIDRITRAQNTQAEKYEMLRRLDKLIEDYQQKGVKPKLSETGADTCPALGGLMLELISQQ